MSIEDDLNEAKALFERLNIKALADEDEEKHEVYGALYKLADAIKQVRKDIEIIKNEQRD